MNYIGSGTRLEQNDIGNAARQIGIETAALLAFIEVECAGKGFDSKNRPKMLFEPHLFYANLGAGTKRNTAISQGIAYKEWKRDYPSDSYPRLFKANIIDLPESLKSASWGLSQILGDKAKVCGYASPEAFVAAMVTGEKAQLDATVKLMASWGIDMMLKGQDLTQSENWESVARKWNGSGYKKNNYHIKLAKAYIKHKANNYTVITPTKEVYILLKNGMKGEAVRNLQADLKELGYKIVVDGQFGDNTEKIVKVFQTNHNLNPDGKAGELTQKAIKKAL